MLKKLTTKGVGTEQREFAERTAKASCFPDCRPDCIPYATRDFVASFSVLLIDEVTMGSC